MSVIQTGSCSKLPGLPDAVLMSNRKKCMIGMKACWNLRDTFLTRREQEIPFLYRWWDELR